MGFPVSFPGKSQGQRILAGYSSLCCEESNTTECVHHTHTHTHERLANEKTLMIIGVLLLHIVLILKLLFMLNYTINKVHWRTFYNMEVFHSLDSEVWL